MAGGLVLKTRRGGLAPWQADLALRLLVRDPCAVLSVAEIAGCCGLSRSHFAKAFKTSMGAPPHKWLMRQRVQRAREMLERTDQSISLIALNCGFSDQSHLTKAFREIVGVSPAAWRRRCRADAARALFQEKPPAGTSALTGP